MHLYKETKRKNADDISLQLLKASKIDESGQHRPHGFDSIVNFDFGNIYVDDRIFELLNDDLCKEIDRCLFKILKEDYGVIFPEQIEENKESKYLGNGNVLAKYEISIGVIQIEKFCDETQIKVVK